MSYADLSGRLYNGLRRCVISALVFLGKNIPDGTPVYLDFSGPLTGHSLIYNAEKLWAEGLALRLVQDALAETPDMEFLVISRDIKRWEFALSSAHCYAVLSPDNPLLAREIRDISSAVHVNVFNRVENPASVLVVIDQLVDFCKNAGTPVMDLLDYLLKFGNLGGAHLLAAADNEGIIKNDAVVKGFSTWIVGRTRIAYIKAVFDIAEFETESFGERDYLVKNQRGLTRFVEVAC